MTVSSTYPVLSANSPRAEQASSFSSMYAFSTLILSQTKHKTTSIKRYKSYTINTASNVCWSFVLSPDTQIAFFKHQNYRQNPRHGHSKFRLQCDTEVYCTVLTNTVMIKATDRLPSSICLLSKYCFQVLVTCIQVLASKLSTNAKFQNL